MAMNAEEFVISGLSAHFPQADHLVDLKEKLYSGVDLVTVDEARWPRGHLGLPERMGKIRDLTKFDAQFFGVNPKQAHLMDPQIRLLLKTTYEAIVDAGYDPETLRGRKVGVFIGSFYVESEEAFNVDTDKVDGYSVLGSGRAMFSNRISYSFDFKGPSVTVDTACSSAMIALNHALLALRAGQCDAAIVGGSNIFLKPATTLSFLRLGMLSPEGRCKSFDSNASGYARSESVGVFFIQRQCEARRIYAKLVHVKANVDGYKTEGITVPSGEAQETLLREVYAEAKVDPLSVGYVEAHGTGTQVGDPQEMDAISNVFCKPRRESPLMIGAVKSNMGHAEAASGVCCVAKVILAMETGVIAANLHFKTPNPNIPSLHDGSVQVVDKATPFPGGPVGINSTGFGGANVHVILGANPGPHVDSIPREKPKLPRLVLLAGRSKESIAHTMDRLVAEGPYPDSAYALLNLVGQPSVKQFPFRSFILVRVDGAGKEVVKAEAEDVPREKRPLWFVFSGMGCQWSGMARQMMNFEVFARSLQRSHDLLTRYGIDLLDTVTNQRTDKQTMASLLASITSIQVALVDMLRALGVQPDGMLGHSLGEIACAYADGCFTAEQAVLCSFWRGRCTDLANLPKGAMAAVGLTWEEASKRCRDGVVPACHNAEDSVTVSGPPDAIARLVQELRAENVFAREVKSGNVAFHSKYVESVGPPLLEHLKKVIPEPKPRSHRWLCSSLPESRWEEPFARSSSPEYHVNNLLSPVLFSEALQHVPDDAVVLDIGPHCLLLPVLRRALGADASCLGLMKRHEDNTQFFLGSLGKLHSLGVKLDLSPLYPPVPLPVPRGTPSIAHLVSWDHSQTWTVTRWNDFYTLAQSSEEIVEVDMETNERDAYLSGHQIDGRVLFPATGYIVLAWKFLAKRADKPFDKMPVVLEDLTFHRATVLLRSSPVRFRVSILRATGDFEISEAGTVVASGRIRMADEDDDFIDYASAGAANHAAAYELELEDIYKELRLRGYEYGECFQGILKANTENTYGKLKWQDNWVTFMDTMLQFGILDAPLRALRLPTRIQKCWIDPLRHAQATEKLQSTGLDVVYEKNLAQCHAGGISIQGVKSFITHRRAVNQAAVLSEYQFVPYVDKESTREERGAKVREYVDVCNGVARMVLQSIGENKPDIHEILEDFCEAPEQVVLRYLRSVAADQGLLRVLAAVKKQVDNSPSSLVTAVQTVTTACKEDLEKDRLNTALFEEDPLRHLLDVVVENTNVKKLHVVEIAAVGRDSVLAPFVSSALFFTNVVLKSDYTLAHPSPDKLAAAQIPEGVKLVAWNPASPAKTKLPEADLVVAWLPVLAQGTIEPFIELLSTLCTEHRFVLVAFRTSLTPAEKFLSAVADTQFSVHTIEAVESILGSSGFSLVALKSDNLSALLLLRKNESRSYEVIPKTVKVKNTHYDWIETLKAKSRDHENKTNGQRLWLIAEDSCTSGVVGLANCLRREAPEIPIRCMFNASLKSGQSIDLRPNNSALNHIVAQDLVMNVYRDGEWGSFRLTGTISNRIPKRPTQFAFLNIGTLGDLSSLQWYESPLQYASPCSAERKNMCSVYYAPLNFRDVMLATGKLPYDALPVNVATSDCLLGLEFSGRDRSGCRVMGLVPNQGIATVVVNTGLQWEVPDTWSLEEASTVPMAYATAYYALLVRGNMRPGESLLIHSGSGGVGQAAISVALSMGCTVFTTVGSQEKREFLMRRFPQLKERNFANSRDLSFERHVLKETRGRGVDLVLNSLAQEKLQASVRCLATNGRFLEIGKVDLSQDSPLGMSVFLKNVSFHGILLESLHDDTLSGLEERRRVVQHVTEGIALGAVRPLDTTRFTIDEAEKAFRFIGSGKHVGKVVLEIRPEEYQRVAMPAKPITVEAVARTYFYEHKSYVIIGGLGGFGLELADWMVNRGCRQLVLTTRSGVRTGYQKLCLRRWRRAGVDIIVSKEDASTEDGTQKIIGEAATMGPVGGIFNLGVVLRDGLLENQTAEACETVCRIKINATQNMDSISRRLCPDLDHFVVFSSLSSGYGNVGQTNYGYANSAMERICECRAAGGLPALAIQWGPIGDVGVFREMAGDDAVVSGTVSQRITSCLQVLDRFMCHGGTVVSSFVKADLSIKLDVLKKRDLVQSVARVFGVKDPSSLNPNASLRELGMDSLMAVEVKQTIERELDFTLSMQEIRRITLNELRKISEGEAPGELASRDSVAHQHNKDSMDTSEVPRLRLLENLAPDSTLIEMNRAQGATPVFIVHPINGHVNALFELARHLPVRAVGIQATRDIPVHSVEKIATAYLQKIQNVQPRGPYHLVGYSFGAAVAFEMAVQLQASGVIVGSLTFLDAAPLYVKTVITSRRIALKECDGDEETTLLCAYIMQFLDINFSKVRDKLKQHQSLEAKKDAALDILLELNPDMRARRKDIATAMSTFLDLLRAGLNYRPKTKFHGEITLIKASRPLIPGRRLPPDYGASDCCEGNVHIKVVEGTHESFIVGQSAQECGSIISQLVKH
ncbi:fatty acid synthase-like [Amblyomma americanum]